ncbi:MAG: hypothetical protein JSR78_12730 [Proteobacteria bacterium]|nr:hypothetical protein [Pseudomonadota bacterium]
MTEMSCQSRYAFVTVFYEHEIELLYLQARSLWIYCDPTLIEKIIVIDNSERPLPKNWQGKLLTEYGGLASQVEIIKARDIARLPWSSGWRTQQILKLMVAKIIPTERYVLLDAKNHLIFPLCRDDLEAPDGRPRTLLHSYLAHPLRSHLERVLTYYGLEPAQHVAHFTATATPFVMYRDIVLNMIADLANRENDRFENAFIRKRLTEFFAYICFILKNRGDLSSLYDFSQQGGLCIWTETADDPKVQEIVDRALADTQPFFSVHRLAIEKFDMRACRVVAKLWHDRKLFGTVEDATSFLLKLQAQYRRSHWTKPIWRAVKVVTG